MATNLGTLVGGPNVESNDEITVLERPGVSARRNRDERRSGVLHLVQFIIILRELGAMPRRHFFAIALRSVMSSASHGSRRRWADAHVTWRPERGGGGGALFEHFGHPVRDDGAGAG
jgi:hypothetical protein